MANQRWGLRSYSAVAHACVGHASAGAEVAQGSQHDLYAMQAGNEARALLLERESQRMRAELAALREGRNVVVPLRLSPLERCCLHCVFTTTAVLSGKWTWAMRAERMRTGHRARLRKLRRKRMVACFVARDGQGGAPIGCALASFLAPEAVLPPPWPTSKPVRLYVSNLAVAPEQRRRGVAAALLSACERLGMHVAPIAGQGLQLATRER